MNQVKIFEGNGNEDEVNAWLRENPDIKVTSIQLQPMHDLYGGHPPAVCNQWVSIVVVYSEGATTK